MENEGEGKKETEISGEGRQVTKERKRKDAKGHTEECGGFLTMVGPGKTDCPGPMLICNMRAFFRAK